MAAIVDRIMSFSPTKARVTLDTNHDNEQWHADPEMHDEGCLEGAHQSSTPHTIASQSFVHVKYHRRRPDNPEMRVS